MEKKLSESARSDAITKMRDADDVTAWLINHISKLLDLNPDDVDVNSTFSKLGLKSKAIVSTTAALGAWLDQNLPSTLGFNYPTIKMISRFLAENKDHSTSRPCFDNNNLLRDVHSTKGPSQREQVPEQIKNLAGDKTEPIAVIGMACRFPGGCNSPDAFHRFLIDGGDAITKVPADRWDADALFDPDPQVPGKMVTSWGGFVDSVDQFDATFFGISPREARSMDPQQRLAIEISWEALEDAGEASERLNGSNTGVFIGISGSDYGRRLFKDWTRLDLYCGTGSSASIVANRISYFLGLRGPSMAVDTACSSSLVALDLACSSLRNGGCGMALAGGVNLILSPEMTIIFSKAGLMAPDGRCKTFDASANGYVRSEGCGIIVLKRYSDAVRDGNRILALIRGSHVNQDGQSNGLTVPNGQAQISLIQDALLHAGATPLDVSYVEAHGTGTAIGDPIEMNSIGAVLGQGRSSLHPLIVGSVKSNIGHLEQAAGIAGVIKVIQSLVHETIPPNLHFKKPNPLIALDDIPAIIPTQPMPWPASTESPRIAGVSGFSFGGVNAHIVFQEAPSAGYTRKPSTWEDDDERSINLMTLSAKNEDALRDMADAYGSYLEDTSDLDMESVCRTAQAGRFHFSHRLALTGRSVEDIAKKLKAYAVNPEGSDIMQTPHWSPPSPEVVFLFTGQGAQYPGMGRALYNSQPVFKKYLDQCIDILVEHLDRPLLPIIFGEDSSLLNETAYTQPALFALEYALARMWQAWGIRPAAVMGHSVGEYTAACLAGVFSLEDGLKLIAARGRLIQALPRNGKMAAVFAGVDPVSEILSAAKDDLVSIAAVNGPENVVISGMAGSVDEVLNRLSQKGIQALPLTVSHAFHSPLMDPMLDAFEKIAAKVSFSVPDIAFVSNLTGEMAHEAVCESVYWRKHVRQPVRFEESIRFLCKSNYHLMLEIGPQPILTGMAKSFLTDDEITCLPSLRRNEHDWRTISETLGNLYTQGARIDWQAFHRHTAGRLVPLPTYPFQRRRYWYRETGAPGVEQETNYSSEPMRSFADFHPQGGKRIETPLDQAIYTYECETNSFYADDHRVYGHAVISGSTLLCMALSVMKDMFTEASIHVADMVVMNPLFIRESSTAVIQVIFHPEDDHGFIFRIHSALRNRSSEQGPWKENAYGRIHTGGVGSAIEKTDFLSVDQMKKQCREEINPDDFYQTIWDSGLQLKDHFRWLRKIWRGNGEAFAAIREPKEKEIFTNGLVAPGLIDSCVQLGFACFDMDEDSAYMFLGYDRFHFYKNVPGKRYCHMKIRKQDSDGELVSGDYRLFNDQGQIIAEAEGIHLKRAPKHALISGMTTNRRDLLYEIDWRPVSPPAQADTRPAEGNWVVLADRENIATQVSAALEGKGILVEIVMKGASFKQTAHNEFTVNPERPEDFSRLIEILTEKRMTSLGGIINLWPLDGTAPDSWSSESLMADQILGCASTLHLIQALTRTNLHPLPPLWTVTRGTQSVLPHDSINPSQAPVWGLDKVIALEHPDMRGGVVDLDSDPKGDDIFGLLNEIRNPVAERYMAFRDGRPYAARLLRMKSKQAASKPVVIPSPGTYLITGGTGGLGLKLAAWLATGKEIDVVLVSRRPFPIEKLPAELAQTDGRIKILQADVTQLDQLAAVFDEIRKSLPPLRGIFHLAGVLDDGALHQQKWQRFEKVMATKMLGAWHLHQLTVKMDLEFFVLFSSVASLLGSPGQGNYSAGNAFMDSLSKYRQSIGLPAISVNWGPFSEAGMAEKLTEADKSRWIARGIGMLDSDTGFSVLDWLMAENPPQAGVMEIDWPRYLKHHPHGGDHPFYEGLFSPSANDAIPDKPVTAKSSDILAKIDRANSEARQKIIEEHIGNHVAEVLWLPEDEQLDVRRPFVELGLDSLMVLELRKRLSRDFEIELAMTDFLRNASVSGLAVKVLDRLGSSGTEKPAPEVPELPQIVPAPEQRALPFPLTDVQHAYWIGRSGNFDLGGVSCHVYPEVEIADLDIEKLENAVNRLVKRHEMLRAVILPDGYQVILPEIPPYRIEVQDLRGQTSDVVKQGLKNYRDRMSQQILSSETGPLFEIRASLLDGGMTRLHISFDLLIGDGWSFNILIRDLYEYYMNPGVDLPPLTLSFRDYVIAEQAIKSTELYQTSLNYWRQRITDLPPAPALPLAKSPGQIENHRFVRLKSRLDKEAWIRLKKRAAKAGLTPSGVLLAAFAEILATWSKDPRFTINLTMFNRLPLHLEVMDIVGDFTTLTLLAVDNGKGKSFEERAGYIQEQLWQDLEHRFVSGIEVLRQMTSEKGSAAGFPVVFTSVLPYSTANDDKTAIGLPSKLAAELKYCISQTPQVWLDHQIFDQDGALVYNWDAVEGLFPEGMLEDMFEAYTRFIESLAQNRSAWEDTGLNLIPEPQLSLREAVNDTQKPISEELLHSLFFNQADLNPDQKALITSEKNMTYKELALRAEKIGKCLQFHNIQPDELVAVVMEKGWEQVVAVLGILWSGSAYLPIDASMPKVRRDRILENGCVRIVLTQSQLLENIDLPEAVQCLAVDQTEYSSERMPFQPVQKNTNLAYVIYTSGSTGDPKGVMIDHRGAVNTICDINRRFDISAKDCVLGLAELSFDLSVYDIFGVLGAGATLVIPDAAHVKDPTHWLKWIEKESITLWNSVPQHMQMLMESVVGITDPLPDSLRLVMLSGDWIPLDLPGKIFASFPKARVISLGGATEASIWSILYPIGHIDPQWKSIPYGRPMDNQQFYVLNKHMQPCPDWVTGDLYIGGIGLAKGYRLDEEKTRQSFVTHPTNQMPLYKTGDLGRYLPDGTIEFQGREDLQVKIRGYRIELGEVETALNSYPGIEKSLVTVKTSSNNESYVVGYIVLEKDAAFSDSDVKQYLEQKIPIYMIPSFYKLLEQFPLSENGKIDYKMLPSPDTMVALKPGEESVPENEMEQIVLPILCEAAGLSHIGVRTNFFDAGINSLHLVRFRSLIKKKLKRDVEMVDLFKYANIRSLSEHFSRKERKKVNLHQADKIADNRQARRRQKRQTVRSISVDV